MLILAWTCILIGLLLAIPGSHVSTGFAIIGIILAMIGGGLHGWVTSKRQRAEDREWNLARLRRLRESGQHQQAEEWEAEMKAAGMIKFPRT